MHPIFISLALLLVSAQAQARMVCKPRDFVQRHPYAYVYVAEELPGGTCGPLDDLIVYAPRNSASLFDFTIASAEAKLSRNGCVETIKGLALDGVEWSATESWDVEGNHMMGHYNVRQENKRGICSSEYTITMSKKRPIR